MKIRRFFASDMRQALRHVREALGADAVILSNKSVQGGVELVAAVDYDESAFNSTQPTSIETQSKPPSDNRSTRSPATKAPYATMQDAVDELPKPTQPKPDQRPDQPRVEWSQDPVLREMRQEMQALRRMM
ncbi:MAG: flagellar biosynthesis protein FlhF, partial [Candidatus Thiodiazotropha sp. (ex Lucinoma borealis)]|nr:flagellar biosynthesis protein FlhF [Candidatus Thiodiazotropha sp. (ex Lucinoma borealis)]